MVSSIRDIYREEKCQWDWLFDTSTAEGALILYIDCFGNKLKLKLKFRIQIFVFIRNNEKRKKKTRPLRFRVATRISDIIC
jgi:hypothetical protein